MLCPKTRGFRSCPLLITVPRERVTHTPKHTRFCYPECIITAGYYKPSEMVGSTVVKVLCYKSEGRWFDPRCGYLNFSLT